MEPDVLYAVRRGERNDALRLSLRSLANLPHRRVIISGYCPPWVRGVTAVEGGRRTNKFDSIEENVRRGLQADDLAEDVVYMNDDFYVTRPVDAVPVAHGGPIDQYGGKQELKIRMRRTYAELRKFYPDSMLYTYDGVHMPLPLETETARLCLADIPQGCLWRTWYGNSGSINGEWDPGVQVPNAKFKAAPGEKPPDELPTFLSTNNHGLQVIRERLEDVLPRDCEYVS